MKWPRHYAKEICDLKSREERREALAKVPERYRQIVMQHVVNTFAIRKAKREASEVGRVR